MLSSAFVAVALAGVALAGPHKRDVQCGSVFPTQDGFGNPIAAPSITPWCSSYLALRPTTVRSTLYTTTVTATTTLSTMVTSTTVATPAMITSTARTTSTAKVTVTPDTSTIYTTTTQTAYDDANGNTLAVMKRAVATPQAFLGLNKADVSSACACLAIPTPTITQVIQARTTVPATKILTRTKIIPSTAPAPLTTTTQVLAKTVNYIAKTPYTTLVVNQLAISNQCPPNWTYIWQCPSGTGINEATDPQELDCPVVADDGYSGDCIYWNDDGSPAGSKLERMARDIVLEKRSNHSPSKTKTQYQAHVQAGLKKLPSPAPKRGGKLRFVGKSTANKKPAGDIIVTKSA